MFGFLNATVLFAAAAALIPLIIHLFSRRRVKVVEFSSLRHLKEMQKRQLRRLKIRQLLLLLLRMLIIFAVVIAFARPTSKDGAVGSHASVSAVILFDNSASMSRYVTDGNLFEIARQRTAQLLKTFSQADEICLMALDRSSESAPEMFSTAAVALERLEQIPAAGAVADMGAAIEKTIRLLGNAINANKEIYIVTDRQRTSLPEQELLRDFQAEIYMVDLPLEDNTDVGVVALDFGGQLIQPGHDFELVATIRNFGRETMTDGIASLFLNGKRVAQTDFEVEGTSESTVRFVRSVTRTGLHSGYVELSDDKYPGNNRYYFSLAVPDQFNVLIIDGDPAARFMSMALKPPSSDGQYWSVKEAKPAQLSGVDFNDYDVVVMVGAPNLEEIYVSRLKSFVRRGKSLLITYGGNTDVEFFNESFADFTGVFFDRAARRDFTRAGYYSLKWVDLDHPIFTVFGFDEATLPAIKFFSLPKLHLLDNARPLALFTGDQAALTEAQFGDGKVLVFTGPMSPEYSDLTVHGFIVPFVSRLAEYLASDLSSLDLRLYTGESITRSLPLAGATIEAIEFIAPDSTVVSIPPEDENGVLVIHTGVLGRSGIYHVLHRGREIDRFAINIDPPECDLASADIDQFLVSLGADDCHRVELGEDMAEVISGFRVGKELWQVFLWIAVLLLALEMILGRRSPAEE
ncbi:MAG: hypothetical protein DRP45_05875 [Candidatus Zixiibacteriota bacterium]|nr:MAG: hypothetical protein DRP45_05875 [candidate division Zixibacteria bacterium]